MITKKKERNKKMGFLPTPRKLKHANLTVSHRHAPKMEKGIAKRLGGKVVKGSGSGAEKGDIRVKNIMRVEAKCTTRKSFTVTREMIEKIEMHALACGELPAIEIEFLDEKGKPSHRVAVVPTYVLEMICAYKREAINQNVVKELGVDSVASTDIVVSGDTKSVPGSATNGPRRTVPRAISQGDATAAG